MGLSSLLPLSPRSVWKRVRAAMCCAFPSGFARPRRLSAAFLYAERQQLSQFRNDARSVLRGKPLPDANDAATGEHLPAEWWARYRCPPPTLPTPGAAVLLADEGAAKEASFVALDGDHCVRVLVDGVERVVNDLDAMVMGESRQPPSPLLLSPLPGFASPAGYLLSPARPLPARKVELELDVRQLAVATRLLDRKEHLLREMKRMSDRVEANGLPPTEAEKERFRSISTELDNIASDLALPRVPPSAPQSLQRTNAPRQLSAEPSAPLLTRPGMITPSPRGTGKTRRRTPLPPVSGPQPPPALMPEHLAKNVDFRNAWGAALLAKALTRAALAKLDPDSKLKMAPTKVRADVMECVSSCVAVLVRARATRDFRCIEEVVDDIRMQFPSNQEALDAIHIAARTFDSSSSESSP